ncbi:MAG: hypothetical protein QGF00_26205 [Planctomycetota bacterium]|jgi:hypothetical protein|nr:hypothetical protein [Planctomycetota bacterium]MDP7253123.1 hypothetical protein [Planctomycetota bacterium]
MSKKPPLLSRIPLKGLEVAPTQVWRGVVRLVPLIRRKVRNDLRLAIRSYGDDYAFVSRDGKDWEDPDSIYCSYVPHGLVVDWSDDGSPVAAYGMQVRKDGKVIRDASSSVRLAHRMVKREDKNRLRMLPLHTAMEGFLSLYFGGPSVAWSEYSRHALSYGLSPRIENTMSGHAIDGLADALRMFEIHEGQVGVLVFVEDALASAMVVSHPADYFALHRALIEDFYCDLFLWAGCFYSQVAPLEFRMNEDAVTSLTDLREELNRMKGDWSSLYQSMADGILDREVTSTSRYRFGPFHLQQFMTDLQPRQENHLGEAIVRNDGTLEYLKTYRLSHAQARRAYLLQQLAAQQWNLDATAGALNCSRKQLIQRLEKAGFGYLLQKDVLREARKQRKK